MLGMSLSLPPPALFYTIGQLPNQSTTFPPIFLLEYLYRIEG